MIFASQYAYLLRRNLIRYTLYQIGTGIETSINDFFNSIKDMMELNGFSVLNPAYLDWREGEVKRSFTDISFATNNLKFKPRFSLIEGMKITIPWFIDNYKKVKLHTNFCSYL